MYIINPGQRRQGTGKVVAPGQERQGIHYNYKTSFQSWKVLTGKFKFYSKKAGGETEEISFSGRIWK